MKLKLSLIASILIALCVSGCARNNANNNDVAYRNNDGTGTRVDYKNTPNRSARITDMNNNATVPRGTDATRDNRTTKGTDVTNYNNSNNNRSAKSTDLNNQNQNTLTIRNNNGEFNPNTFVDNSRMKVANIAAKKVAAMNEVDTSYILVTNNNAYAAVKLASGQRLTNSLKNGIANRIRSVDRGINNVYISANPDFYKNMGDYANDIRNGNPASGFFTQFSQMINRIFPDVK